MLTQLSYISAYSSPLFLYISIAILVAYTEIAVWMIRNQPKRPSSNIVHRTF